MLSRLAFNEVFVRGKLLGGNVEVAGHSVEYTFGMGPVASAELEQAEQQHGALTVADATVQSATDGTDGGFRVQLVGHLVCGAHVAVEFEVLLSIADAEVMAQITDKHFDGTVLVNLFYLPEQGE